MFLFAGLLPIIHMCDLLPRVWLISHMVTRRHSKLVDICCHLDIPVRIIRIKHLKSELIVTLGDEIAVSIRAVAVMIEPSLEREFPTMLDSSLSCGGSSGLISAGTDPFLK